MNFNDLKRLNEEKIKCLNFYIKRNSNDTTVRKQLEINTKIQKLLEKDEALFLKISIDDSYNILKQILNEDESIQDAYIDLTSPQEYKRLMDDFKV